MLYLGRSYAQATAISFAWRKFRQAFDQIFSSTLSDRLHTLVGRHNSSTWVWVCVFKNSVCVCACAGWWLGTRITHLLFHLFHILCYVYTKLGDEAGAKGHHNRGPNSPSRETHHQPRQYIQPLTTCSTRATDFDRSLHVV